MAIGAYYNGGNNGAGHVRIYHYAGDTWTQVGDDIDGEAAGDRSGSSVSLSADGAAVAIGALGNDGSFSSAGHVRIYHYAGDTWTQVGDDIDGEAAWDGSGSVSLSVDGTTVAIGAIGNDGNGNDAGHVRIYHLEGDTWTQLFGDIDGEVADDRSGSSVSLSADGTTVAIGAYYNGGNGANAGHVRIYGLRGGRVVLQVSSNEFPPGCSTTNGGLRLNSKSPTTAACSEDHKCLCKRRGIDSFTNRSPEVCRKKQFYKSANYYRSENICDSDSTLNASECEAAAEELGLQFSTTTPVPNGCIMHDNGHVTYKNGIYTQEDYCAYNTGKECICKSDGLDRDKCHNTTGLQLADLTQEDYGTYYRSSTTCSPSDSFDNAQECKVAAEWLDTHQHTFGELPAYELNLTTNTIGFSPENNTNGCFLDGTNFYWNIFLSTDCGNGGCVCKRNELPKGCSTYQSKAYWSDNSNENPNGKYHKVDIIPDTNFR